MGLKLTIPTTFTDTTLPVLTDDPLVTYGSLIFMDPTHPAAPMAAGVPASGYRMPNIAQGVARALLGDNAAEVRPQLEFGSSWAGVDGSIERSGKGGIHGIVDNPLPSFPGKGFGFRLPSAIAAWIIANPTHDFYAGVSGKITRVSGETNPATQVALSVIGQAGANMTSSYLYRLSLGITRPIAASSLGIRNVNTPDVLGDVLTTIGVPNTTTSAGAVTDLSTSRVVNWGTDDSIGTIRAASWVFYSYALEDLTVSGRTWAQVDALHAALHTAQVSTAGGRYNGDTFTTPVN